MDTTHLGQLCCPFHNTELQGTVPIGWRERSGDHQLPWDMAGFPNISRPDEEGSVQGRSRGWGPHCRAAAGWDIE